MNRIEKLNKIQRQAVKALQDNNFKGTLFMSVRSGKGITTFKTLYKMFELGLIKKGDTIRFWSKFVTASKKMLLDEEQASIKILGKNPFEDFNFIFKSVQSANKSFENNVTVEIYDEIDSILAKTFYLCILNSTCKYKIGLTGTINRTANVFLDQIDDEMKGRINQSTADTKKGLITSNINKGQLLDVVLPIVYTFTTEQAIQEGIINNFQTTILEHSLGTKIKYLTPKGWKIKMSEKDYYQNRESARRDFNKPKYLRGLAGKEQMEMLYNLDSKNKVTSKLLEYLTGKTLIFGVRKKPLYEITPNVCESKNTLELIDKFRSGKITELASAKMISRVLSLPGVENVIMYSYITTPDIIQMLGRSLLFQKGKIPNVFFFRTSGTREEMWFEKLQEEKDNKGNITGKFDLRIKKIISTKSLWLKDFKL